MKTKNSFDLDPERLASTDENGDRIYIHPEEVKGKWKTRRRIVSWFLMILYLVLPWIYVDGKPALFLNIKAQEFTLFGMTLHGFEPIFFFLLAASGLFLIAFLTSVFGRVWCGWACPQTVFIQELFNRIDQLFEGKARARRTLDQAPMSVEKFLRRSGKWLAFTIVSLHIAHTFVGYFVGPRELLQITLHSPSENFGIFIATMTLAAIFLFDFGWFREQFCIIACPYGRIQSVMMDESSKVVAYDLKRGEPRRGTVPKGEEGDCVNCYACVRVCPTGIDIRRGNQLECIACTHCIDACDDIMTKVGKPTGLIRYSSEQEMNGTVEKKFPFRSLIYITVFVSLISGMGIFLKSSSALSMLFIRSTTPFILQDEGRIVLNQFTLKLSHQGSAQKSVNLSTDDARVVVKTSRMPIAVTDNDKKVMVFLRFPENVLVAGGKKINVIATDGTTGEVLASREITLVGPVH